MGAEVRRRFDGSELVRLREALELTQEELADQLGISRSYVAHIEAGDREFTPDLRRRVLAIVSQQTKCDTISAKEETVR